MPPLPPTSFSDALARVHDRIEQAHAAAGRGDAQVRLLLATKTQDAETIRAAVLADRESARPAAVLVGENRVQELTAKAPALADLGLTAHLIGPLQSNKVNHALRALAEHRRACIETVDSVALAERLGRRVLAVAGGEVDGEKVDGEVTVGGVEIGRKAAGEAAESGALPGDAVLDVYLQVNVSGEESKAGVAPEHAVDVAHAVAEVAGLRLRGFMTIGEQSTDESRVRAGFARLRSLRDQVAGSGALGTSTARELSMGMSRDLEWAVAEGATVVRVGSAVFGAR